MMHIRSVSIGCTLWKLGYKSIMQKFIKKDIFQVHVHSDTNFEYFFSSGAHAHEILYFHLNLSSLSLHSNFFTKYIY